MSSIRIGTGNRLPSFDGDINLYSSPDVRNKSWFRAGGRVIYVNGMDNQPINHKTSALKLSELRSCPVVGVFNQSDGKVTDLWQCVTDKATLVSVQADGDFRKWEVALEKKFQEAKSKQRGLQKTDFVAKLIQGNRATLSLYHYFLQLGASLQATPIYCHSQGNLVTSNALTALALAKGAAAIKGVSVNSFGSPCKFWPKGITHVQRAFTFDPVTWLDLTVGFQFVKVGFVAGHGFELYMDHDAEFTVNQFRWGSFGLTASMDELGLANYLVKIGYQPTRLWKIFKRLYDSHNSDVDDVAEIYCRKMREHHPSVLQSIAKAHEQLILLLIKSMEEGWTASGERKEINHLKTLL